MNETHFVPLASLMASRTGTVNPSNFSDEVFDLYSIPAFDAGQPELTPGHQIGSPKQIVLPGDVLLSKIVPHIRRCWIVGPDRGKRIIASGEWIVFRSSEIDPRYLRHVLASDAFHLQFMNTVAGVGGSLIRARPAFVAQILIPVPPIKEQLRIAEVLDRVEALRAKRRAAIVLLDDLAQSIFLDMFGDLIENERMWPIGRVSDIVSHFESGKSFAPGSEGDPDVRYRVLKVSAVTSGQFLPAESKPVPPTYEPPESHIVQTGDLLFSRANTESLIGATALVSSACPNLILPDKLWRFAWHASSPACPFYVRQLFRQIEFRREIARRSTGTSGSMKNISQAKVLSIECGIPTVDLRCAYNERMKIIESLTEKHRSHLAELNALFGSLQHRAFRRELWDDLAA